MHLVCLGTFNPSTNQIARSKITEQPLRVFGFVLGLLKALIYLISLQYLLKKQHKVTPRIEATSKERIYELVNFLLML